APNAGIRRAGGPVVNKLAAPVAKANTQAALIEPPPVIAGSPNALENSGLFDAGRGNGPAMPAVPVSRMGGQLQQPKLISSPSATYPSAARAGRVQGVVVIDAEIDTTGKVASMKPIIGHIL